MTDDTITAVLAELDALVDMLNTVYDECYSGDYYADGPFNDALAVVWEHRNAFARKYGRAEREDVP